MRVRLVTDATASDGKRQCNTMRGVANAGAIGAIRATKLSTATKAKVIIVAVVGATLTRDANRTGLAATDKKRVTVEPRASKARSEESTKDGNSKTSPHQN